MFFVDSRESLQSFLIKINGYTTPTLEFQVTIKQNGGHTIAGYIVCFPISPRFNNKRIINFI